MASNVYKNFAIETNGFVYRAKLWWTNRWIFKNRNGDVALTRFKFRAYRTSDLYMLFHYIDLWCRWDDEHKNVWWQTYYEISEDGKRIEDVGSASPSPEPEEIDEDGKIIPPEPECEPTAGTVEIPKDEENPPDRRQSHDNVQKP